MRHRKKLITSADYDTVDKGLLSAYRETHYHHSFTSIHEKMGQKQKCAFKFFWSEFIIWHLFLNIVRNFNHSVPGSGCIYLRNNKNSCDVTLVAF